MICAIMVFQIAVTRRFSASHQLRLYDGSLEERHGHDWVVRVTVGAPALDRIGLVMDFHELERLVDAVCGPMRDRHLNDLPAFAATNPTAENVAQYLAASIHLPPAVHLVSVEVWETPDNLAVLRY